MRNLLLSSILVLLLYGCHPGHYNKLRSGSSFAEQMPAPLFGENFSSSLFKANITVYGRELSGLLVTKQLSAGDYRVIFTTELGIKLFDFEFRDTSFTLHYCVPQFNRPKLLKVIQQDISTLLMTGDLSRAVRYSDAEAKNAVFKITGKPHDLYYFVDRNTGKLSKIERAKGRQRKVMYDLSDYNDGFPNLIQVTHFDTKLKMTFNLLRK